MSTKNLFGHHNGHDMMSHSAAFKLFFFKHVTNNNKYKITMYWTFLQWYKPAALKFVILIQLRVYIVMYQSSIDHTSSLDLNLQVRVHQT